MATVKNRNRLNRGGHRYPPIRTVITDYSIVEFEEEAVVVPDPLSCCGEHMSRVNCGGDEWMCMHHRLLTGPCDRCKSDHNGILTWECRNCGRVYRDAPHLVSGPAALAVNYGVGHVR